MRHGLLAPAHRPRGRQPGDTELSGILEVLLSMAAELQTNQLTPSGTLQKHFHFSNHHNAVLDHE
jgi:hypothetical protein